MLATDIFLRKNTQTPHKVKLLFSLVLPLIWTLIWLRFHPCYYMLSLLFDSSSNTVCAETEALCHVLCNVYFQNITWPTLDKWYDLFGGWSNIT